MNRKLKLSLAGVALALASALPAGAQGLADPMTKAMMDVYEQELNANPKAYDVYFRRANEYYKFDQYLRALSDVDNAIKYAPADDADMQFQCHMLRGEIYQMLGKHTDALADFTEALRLDPSSFMALYQKGNEEYELGKYAEAKASFNRLRATNGRSAEALTGLARIAVKENNLGLASQYMDDAVSMMPSESDIYVRRASVRSMLGNNTGAVDDLIMAISIDSSPKAFQELINMSNNDYPAVITALSNAVHQAPEQGMFYYIRAVIAQAHNHFPSAIDDYRKLIDDNMYNYAGIYASLGECYYALCDFDRALENINQAIGMTADNGVYYVPLAQTYRAQERYDDAMRSIESAVEKLGDNRAPALTEKGRLLYSLKKYQQAAEVFSELSIDSPDNPMYYMLRAWATLAADKDRTSNALAIYRRMLDLDVNTALPSSLYGFALLFSGDKDGALRWAGEMLRDNHDTDGSVNYLCACLYAQAEETDRAFDCLEAALNKGYSNRYEFTRFDDARMSLAPLRSLPRFNELLTNYSYIFAE